MPGPHRLVLKHSLRYWKTKVAEKFQHFLLMTMQQGLGLGYALSIGQYNNMFVVFFATSQKRLASQVIWTLYLKMF